MAVSTADPVAWSRNGTLATTDNYGLPVLQTELALRDEISGAILSDREVVLLNYILLALNSVLSTLGIITNATNAYAFLRLGVKESVTLTLLSLSCSDLTFSSMRAITTVSFLLDYYEKKKGTALVLLDPVAVLMFAGNVGVLSYTVTTLITTYLAVTRCMCVAKPLHFKTVFTTKRTLIALLVCFLVPYVTYLPVLTEMGTVVRYIPRYNITRPVFWMSKKRNERRQVSYFILFICLQLICQALVVLSVVILIVGLKKTSSFRNAMKTPAYSGEAEQTPTSPRTIRGTRKEMDVSGAPEKLGHLSGKELQVARQVVLVCIIFFVSSVPQMGITLTQLAVPEFNISGRYRRFYTMINAVAVECFLLNACTSIFVYLKFNTAFRNALCAKKE